MLLLKRFHLVYFITFDILLVKILEDENRYPLCVSPKAQYVCQMMSALTTEWCAHVSFV